MRKIIYLIPVFALVFTVSSCISDDVAPLVVLKTASGDTITSDTIDAVLNSVLTIISETRDEQDIKMVEYFRSYSDSVGVLIEEQIDYAAPILLTNRHKEAFVDISLPDSLYEIGGFGAVRVRAEDNAGNVTEVQKTITIN